MARVTYSLKVGKLSDMAEYDSKFRMVGIFDGDDSAINRKNLMAAVMAFKRSSSDDQCLVGILHSSEGNGARQFPIKN
jgi:hypothetical protein